MDQGNLFFSFQGRINRAKYWLTVLVWLAAWIVAGAVAGFFIYLSSWVIGGVILLILVVPSLVSSIAVGIKRLHDRDKSGWWLLLFYLAPSVLQQLGAHMGAAGLLLSIAGLAISIWAIVELGCLRGTAGRNQYGPDPLAALAMQTA